LLRKTATSQQQSSCMACVAAAAAGNAKYVYRNRRFLRCCWLGVDDMHVLHVRHSLEKTIQSSFDHE
jgi:hypothetical protein